MNTVQESILELYKTETNDDLVYIIDQVLDKCREGTRCPRYKTDKELACQYISNFYDSEFAGKAKQVESVLEIGSQYGFGAKLLHDFFINAHISTIESHWTGDEIMKQLKLPRLTHLHSNGYDLDTVDKFQGKQFDYIIDDGPHSVESWEFAITNWTSLLKPSGKMIIEDIHTCVRQGHQPEEICEQLSILAESHGYNLQTVITSGGPNPSRLCVVTSLSF